MGKIFHDFDVMHSWESNCSSFVRTKCNLRRQGSIQKLMGNCLSTRYSILTACLVFIIASAHNFNHERKREKILCSQTQTDHTLSNIVLADAYALEVKRDLCISTRRVTKKMAKRHASREYISPTMRSHSLHPPLRLAVLFEPDLHGH
jgi:hypothetical protein